MSETGSFHRVHARFETMQNLLKTLRIDEEDIRNGTRLAADAAIVRQSRVIESLCEISAVMQAKGDFALIENLLAEAEEAAWK
jgi:hypothetical protein